MSADAPGFQISETDRIRTALQTAPIREVRGVVDARGAGGGQFPPATLWSLSLQLIAWRIDDGPVRDQSLRVTCTVPENELRALMNLIRADAIVRLRARIVENGYGGTPTALLEEVVDADANDPDLLARREELTKPESLEDPRFGKFVWDRGDGRYHVKATWSGQRPELSLDVHPKGDRTEDTAACLTVARRLWDEEADWNAKILNYAAAKLLDLKNDVWADEDEPPFTAESFKNRMTLNSVSVYPSGKFEFWYDDGDLFFGHSILVSGDLDGGLNYAGIQG